MKKRVWLWVVKISAVLIWVLTLFIPDVYIMIHGEETFVVKEIETYDNTKKAFEIEFSEVIVNGHVDFIFYDENDERVYAMTAWFGEKSKFGEAEFEDEDLSKAVRFETEFPYAKTVGERKVDVITAWVSAFMLVVVILVLRIDFEEYEVDEKKVEVYSGLLKHKVKVDGEKVFKKNWFTLFKGREIVLNVSEEKDAKVKFTSMNKIDVEITDKQKSGEILKEANLVEQEDVENVELKEKKSQKEKVAKKKK